VSFSCIYNLLHLQLGGVGRTLWHRATPGSTWSRQNSSLLRMKSLLSLMSIPLCIAIIWAIR